MNKYIISLFFLMGVGTAQAYKLSDYTEFKEAKKLCMQRHSAESCARTEYLFQKLFFEVESPITKTPYGSTRRVHESHVRKNSFYKIGCSLGDNIQCFHYDINAFEIKVISEYSSIKSGRSALKYSRRDEVALKRLQLQKKYLDSYTQGSRQGRYYLALNEWYEKASTVTIDEVKRQKSNDSLWSKKKTIPSSSKQKVLKSITTDEKQLLLYLKAYFEKYPKDYKYFISLPKLQRVKIFQSLKGERRQVFTQLSKALKPPSSHSARRLSTPLSHMHAKRSHSHKLPPQGKAHRHGDSAIGK